MSFEIDNAVVTVLGTWPQVTITGKVISADSTTENNFDFQQTDMIQIENATEKYILPASAALIQIVV